MSVKERINNFIHYKKISTRAFERAAGLNYGYINGIRVSIQPDKVSSIAIAYPELNIGWLLTGEGEMLKMNENKISQSTVSGHNISGHGNQLTSESDKLLDLLRSQGELLKETTNKKDEQIDRLLSLLEKSQK